MQPICHIKDKVIIKAFFSVYNYEKRFKFVKTKLILEIKKKESKTEDQQTET